MASTQNAAVQQSCDGLLNIIRVAPRQRSSSRTRTWRDIYQEPLRTAQKLADSCRRRWQTAPTPWLPLDGLDVELVATVGVHDPSAAIVAAAREQQKKSVLFLTSDEDAARALSGSNPRRRDIASHRWAILHADAVIVQTEVQRRLVRRTGQDSNSDPQSD